MFSYLINLGQQFSEQLIMVYHWFFREIEVNVFLANLRFGGIGLGQSLADLFTGKLSLTDTVVFTPADLIFQFGLPALLTVMLVRWIIESFL